MITIFNGRKRGLEGSGEEVYAQISVTLREHIHLFRKGNCLNSLALFITIALHADSDGWAYPSTSLIKDETGITSEEAISACIDHLRSMRINGCRILAHYRTRQKDGRWGRSYYHIFPDAGGADKQPIENLIEWKSQPPPPMPGVVVPGMELGGDSYKDNHLEGEPDSEDSLSGGSAPEVKTKRRKKSVSSSGKSGSLPPIPPTPLPKNRKVSINRALLDTIAVKHQGFSDGSQGTSLTGTLAGMISRVARRYIADKKKVDVESIKLSKSHYERLALSIEPFNKWCEGRKITERIMNPETFENRYAQFFPGWAEKKDKDSQGNPQPDCPECGGTGQLTLYHVLNAAGHITVLRYPPPDNKWERTEEVQCSCVRK